jgi:TolB-like protein
VADIFISYASEDRERVVPLVEHLQEAGFSIWWDRQLQGGAVFPKEIEDEVNRALVVLVAWSVRSVESPWVADEAELGRGAGKLIPLAFDPINAPMGFRQIQTIDFSNWSGQNDSAFKALTGAIERIRAGNAAATPTKGLHSPIDAFAPPSASIAVLPFVNMSADPEQDYFSDGISEELLNLFAKIKEAHVAARTSSFKFKGADKDIREIGRALNVAHILEGSVRKAGSQVRITAQLIQTDTGYHLWSETYDRKLVDIFEIQDEISRVIVKALRPKILDLSAVPQVTRSSNVRSYDFYLLGQQQLKSRTLADTRRGKQFFEQALKLDENYVPAMAGLALTHLLLSDGFGCLGETPLVEASRRALSIIQAAREIDPGAHEALVALAYNYQLHREFEKAIETAEMALAINHNDTSAWSILSASHAQSGDPRVFTGKYWQKILQLDPLSIDGHRAKAHHDYTRHKFEEARVAIDKMEELSPLSSEVTVRRIWLAINEGKYAQALAEGLEKADHCYEVSVRRALLPALIFLGEGPKVEHWDPSFALLYYSQAGYHDDAARMADIVMARPNLKEDYRLCLDLALQRTIAGRLQEALDLLAPFDEPDPERWGLHYHLTYGLIGAELAVYLRQSLGVAQDVPLYTKRLFEVYKALAIDPYGTHLIAHRIGAFLALLNGERSSALDLLEQQVHYSIYGALQIRSFPFFESLKGEPRFQAIDMTLLGHFEAERKAALAAGHLPLPESWGRA